MAFSKTGDVKISKVFCGCGQEINGVTSGCSRCGKSILPTKNIEEGQKECCCSGDCGDECCVPTIVRGSENGVQKV